MPPVPDLNLDANLAALEAEATHYPSTRATFLPDFVLYSFATDVREHATAVQLLTPSTVPRAAFANARAALESALDLAFLVADEKLFAYRGAQARVAELYESVEMERRAAPLNPPLPTGAPAPINAEDIIVADALTWDRDAPGEGDALRRAWDMFPKNSGSTRKHWSLLPKKEVIEKAFTGDDAKAVGAMTSVIHAILSTASHPRPRAGSRDIRQTEDGGFLLGTRASDPEMARQIAAFACALATQALKKRRKFGGIAT